jgi:tetratricopeptide (TPR) repeat protein
MKSERRHELETNELANWLAKVIEAIKPYGNAILAVTLLVVVTGIIYVWWARQSAAKTSDGWTEYYQLLDKNSDPADFEELAQQYPETRLAHWSTAVAGDFRLAMGCNLLFVNKAAAEQELRRAADDYAMVRRNSREPELQERAAFGLARAYEAQGDLKQAREYYQKVATDWPNGAFADESTRRLKNLERPATKAMYDRLAKYDPKPSRADELETSEESLPFDFESLPDDGSFFQSPLMDLEEKGPGGEKSDAATESATEDDATSTAEPQLPSEPELTEPAASEPAPSESKSDDSEPDEAEATEAAPAESQPADSDQSPAPQPE